MGEIKSRSRQVCKFSFGLKELGIEDRETSLGTDQLLFSSSFSFLFHQRPDLRVARVGKAQQGIPQDFSFFILQLYVFHDHERISRKGGYYSTLRKKALTDEAQASWDHHWICEQMPVSVGQDDKEDREKEGGRK